MRIVVTGTGPGSIGLATAQALAAQGHEVLTSTRSTPVDGFAWHPLDLADRGSVAEFAAWVRDSGPLDALVNNAGVHLDLRNHWKEPHLVDGHEVHWRTNYLGTVDLTRALLPALLEQAARTGDARVVHVVSKLHARGNDRAFFSNFGRSHGRPSYNSWDAYGTSKLGLVHDAASLARRYQDQWLRAYSLHPGAVATGISAKGMESSPVLKRLHAAAAPLEKLFLKSPERGARASVHCATDPDAQSGYYDSNARPKEPARQAGDLEARAALWARTEAWLTGEQ